MKTKKKKSSEKTDVWVTTEKKRNTKKKNAAFALMSFVINAKLIMSGKQRIMLT